MTAIQDERWNDWREVARETHKVVREYHPMRPITPEQGRANLAKLVGKRERD